MAGGFGTRNDILDNIVSALQNITTANNYNNDVGTKVSRDFRTFSETNEFPFLYVVGMDQEHEHSDQITDNVTPFAIGIFGYMHQADGLSQALNELAEDIIKAVTVDEQRGGFAYDTRIARVDEVCLPPHGEILVELHVGYFYNKGT